MSETLAACAADTVRIVNAGGYDHGGAFVDLRALVDHAVGATTVHTEAALWARVEANAQAQAVPSSTSSVSPTPACWSLRSGACVQRLLAEGAARVAVLNYANGVRPGGGFLHGAAAQEEALCRCSALYACLASPASTSYYEDNIASRSALVRGHVITSPDVPFFRDEQLALLPTPFVATVLTAAAPDLGWLLAATTEGLEPTSRFSDVPAVFQRRARLIVQAAVDAGCDALVAGPWGCGAFGNDADVVAAAFDDALAVARGTQLSRVVFSTWGPADNRAAFERQFAPEALSFQRQGRLPH